MSQSLTFNEVTLSPVQHQGSLWIRATELARALGYSQENSVSRLFRKNAEEFTPDMTQVIEIAEGADSALSVKTRIFSPRGCHLISMFARTSVAKAFRRWVLDVLDKLNQERQPEALAPDAGLSPSLRAELKAIVDAKLSTYPASVQGKARAEIWTRFNRHFRIAEYAQLPPSRMPEARDLLIEMRVRALAQMPAMPPAELPAAVEPEPAERPLIYRDGCFYPPHKNRKHVAGPREKAIMDFWSFEFPRREKEQEEHFKKLLEDIDGAVGDIYPHTVADIGRNADTMFSISCLLEGFYCAEDRAREAFKDALRLARLHMRMATSMAVALNR